MQQPCPTLPSLNSQGSEVKPKLSNLWPLSRHLASGCGSVIWTEDLGVSGDEGAPGRSRPPCESGSRRGRGSCSSRAVGGQKTPDWQASSAVTRSLNSSTFRFVRVHACTVVRLRITNLARTSRNDGTAACVATGRTLFLRREPFVQARLGETAGRFGGSMHLLSFEQVRV